MKNTAAAGALALLVVACGATTEATTTVTGSTSTSGTTTSVTVPTTEAPATTNATDTTDNGPPPTLPAVIAQVAFAFAEGDNPSVLVQVSVGESSDGPWAPAGDPDVTPTLTGPTYWVRFDITNTDGLGAVLTDLDISGFEPLSLDMCELEAPLPQDAETSCVIGGFPVQPGENEIEFDASGVGHRQGFKPDKWYQPPIPTSLDFDEAPNSFVLVFDTEEGTRLEGKADASEVEIDVGSVSGTIQLDCNGGTRFDGTPALEAYVIEKFSANGSSRERCSVIPTAELPFSRDDSDDVYFYFGEQGTTVTTTTISDTTTVTG